MKKKILITALMASIVMTAAAAQERRGGPDFSTYDTNGDGGVTLVELQAHEADQFSQTDTDGDGALSAEELTAVAGGRGGDRATRMLERLDENQDGLLQQAEMSQRGGERMFERADADADGIITQAEFDAAQQSRGDHERHSDQG